MAHVKFTMCFLATKTEFEAEVFSHRPLKQTHTHTRLMARFGTTQVGRYQQGKTNLDFTEARDSEWQRHQLGHMQVCTSLQTDNHASTRPLSFLQAGCPSCRPTNSVKALKQAVNKNFRTVTAPHLNYRKLALTLSCSGI